MKHRIEVGMSVVVETDESEDNDMVAADVAMKWMANKLGVSEERILMFDGEEGEPADVVDLTA